MKKSLVKKMTEYVDESTPSQRAESHMDDGRTSNCHTELRSVDVAERLVEDQRLRVIRECADMG